MIASFDAFTDDQARAANDAVATVRSKYQSGWAKVGADPTGAYRRLGGAIEQWATTLRANAERGTKSTGARYTFVDWANYGKRELADSIQYLSGVAVPDSTWTNVKTAFAVAVKEAAQGAAKVASEAVSIAASGASSVLGGLWSGLSWPIRIGLIGVAAFAVYNFTKKGDIV